MKTPYENLKNLKKNYYLRRLTFLRIKKIIWWNLTWESELVLGQFKKQFLKKQPDQP